MKIRGVDTNNDWMLGSGMQSYATDLQCLMQNLKTRLLSWVGDCFFDQAAGVDWINLLDYNRQAQLTSAIKSVAFKTAGVLRVNTITVSVTNRIANIYFSVDTIYGSNVQSTLQLEVGS